MRTARPALSGLVLPVLAGAKCKPLELKEDCVCVCNPTPGDPWGEVSTQTSSLFFFFFFLGTSLRHGVCFLEDF